VTALLLAHSSAAAAIARPDPAVPSNQVPFLENVGQIPGPEVRYYAELASGSVFVTRSGELVYALRCPRSQTDGVVETPARWAFRESFVGASGLQPSAAAPSDVLISCYKGAQPDRWRPHVPAFERVDLGEVLPGIRVELRAGRGNVEKRVYVAPGARVGALEIAVDGVEGLFVDDAGRLVLRTAVGGIVFTAPEAWQEVDGERQEVDVRYALHGESYGFALGAHRPDREVVIDPLLSSTFLGGSNPNPPGNYDDDIVHTMSAFGGLVYVAGATQSPDFPIHMGYDDTLDSSFPDAFVALLSGDLSTVLASTYLGTVYSDRVQGMALDASGAVVITGQAGYGFPVTPGAYTYSGTTPAGGGFVARLSPDLSTLEASAVVTPSDFPRALALGNGSVFFGGSTNNPDFPVTPGAWRTSCCPPGGFGIRPYEGFAGRISQDLATLEAMTYLGGNTVSGMDVASDGTVLLTDGFDHAVTGYLARFDGGFTTRMAYLSYYPGSNSGSSRTYFNDVLVDGDTVVVAGQTYMNDLPATPGAFDTTCGTDGLCNGVGSLLVPRSDAFVARYSLDLQVTHALTYLGGSDHESARALALASNGDLLVVGETLSADFPTSANGFDSGCGTDGRCNPSGPFDSPVPDAFLVRLTGNLTQLEYGTYLGGSDEEMAYDVAVGGGGDVFVGGQTRSSDFPVTSGALDESYNGGTSDAFVSRFDASPAQPTLRERARTRQRAETDPK
jgi:hypothetical protein